MKDDTGHPPSLKGLQCCFSEALIETNDQLATKACEPFIEGRLSVYQHAYHARLIETLGDDFKMSKRAMGEDAFSSCITRYLKEYPSRYTNISDVGRDLSRFLKSTEYGTELPFLSEIAGLEWAILESFWAENRPLLNLEGVNENSALQLHPCVRLLEFEYDVHSVYSNFEKEDELFFQPPDRVKTYLVVHRENHVAQVKRVSEKETGLLESLKNGLKLTDLPTNFDPAEIQAVFQRWTAWGLFS